jgi:hypothetical protein
MKTTRHVLSAIVFLLTGQNVYSAGSNEIRVPTTVSGGFDPQLTQPFRMDFDSLSIVVPSAEDPVVLRISYNSGSTAEVRLPDVFEQAYHARLVDRSLVLFGWMNPLLAANVLILDSTTGSFIDDFWCYEPSVSPNGRSIVFLRFFPSHFAYGVESQYRAYTTAAGPRLNRSPESISSKIEVGKSIYPTDAREATRSNINIPNSAAHFKRSAFFWSPDSAHVAFVDEQSRQLSLVAVTFNLQGEASRVMRAPLPAIHNLCMKSSPSSGCLPLPINDVKLEFNGSGVIAFRTQKEGGQSVLWGKLHFLKE